MDDPLYRIFHYICELESSPCGYVVGQNIIIIKGHGDVSVSVSFSSHASTASPPSIIIIKETVDINDT